MEANWMLDFNFFSRESIENDNYVLRSFDASKLKAGRRSGSLFELRDFSEFKGVIAAR
jgi:hypothetical protein